MTAEDLKKTVKSKYCWLVLAVFVLIFLSRFCCLEADLPSALEVEEKSGGYNARNMVVLGHWPLYLNWFQPMVYQPVQTLLSYVAFSIFGLGLAQFRLPMVLAGFIGLIFFYLLLLKQTNRGLALLALVLYAFSYGITLWNRSALCENLYFLLMPLSVYILTKERLSQRNIFLFVFLAALGVVVKLDGYPFYGAAGLFLLIYSIKNKSLKKNIMPLFLGSILAGIILLGLYYYFGAFTYFSHTYQVFFQVYGQQASLIKGLIPSLNKLISIMLSLDPYIVLAFLAALFVWIFRMDLFDRVDWFMAVYLPVAFITRLQAPAEGYSWKRTIPLFLPIFYVIFRSLYFLSIQYSWSERKKEGQKALWRNVITGSICGFSLLAVFLTYFNRSITRLFGFEAFAETFHYSTSVFFYLLIIVLAIIGATGMIIFSPENRKARNTLLISILILITVSFISNLTLTAKLYLPGNIKYSYNESKKILENIPENEIIICHEQAFRGLAYLSKHEFYFNHDGGPTPSPFREVFERNDLRYFILNTDEFRADRWGLPNKTRLELLKQVYPDLKLLGMFSAANIRMAVYDKYGNQ